MPEHCPSKRMLHPSVHPAKKPLRLELNHFQPGVLEQKGDHVYKMFHYLFENKTFRFMTFASRQEWGRRMSWLCVLPLPPCDRHAPQKGRLGNGFTAFFFPFGDLTLRLSGPIYVLESNQTSCCITAVPLKGVLGRDE